MKNKKMILWIALIVKAIIPIYAQQYDSEKDFKIDWDDNVKNGVIITRYIGTKNEVRIPPSIQNNPVTGIGERAFYENKNITRVIIPNSVTSIGEEAFFGCTNLTNITIPNSVTSIEFGAFFWCTKLTSITIPNNVTSIGENAFIGCSSLTSVTFEGILSSSGLHKNAFLHDDNPVYTIGDLRDKYLASDGGSGTYRRLAGGTSWRKM